MLDALDKMPPRIDTPLLFAAPRGGLWYLARIMGASVVMLEDTYARWLKRTDDQLGAALDSSDAREATG